MNMDARILLARVLLSLRKRQSNILVKEQRAIIAGAARPIRRDLSVRVSAVAEVLAVRCCVTVVERYGLASVIGWNRRATDKHCQHVSGAKQSNTQILSVICADTFANANHLRTLISGDLVPRKISV